MSERDDKRYVTPRQLIIAGAVAGFAMAATIVAVIFIANAINDVQQQEIADNQDRIDHQAKINHDLRAAIRTLKLITHPTPKQYRRQIREGIRRCLHEPSCRRLFPKLGHAARNASSTPIRPRPSVPPAVSRTTPEKRRTGGETTPTRTQPTPVIPSKPTPTSSSAPPSPPASPPPPPPAHPAANLQAPLPVEACVDGLAGVNC